MYHSLVFIWGPSDGGTRMSDPTFTMECRCGRAHSFEPAASRIECECGALYAVTITELRAPRTDSEPPPDR